MHFGVHFAGYSSWESRDGLEFLQRGVQECFWGAEVGQYLLLTLWADAGEVVEDRGGHGPAAELRVVSVGEAVGLVADALEEVQFGGVALQDHRLGPTRLEDLLLAFGERAQGYVRLLVADLHLLEDGDDSGELPLTAVEQDQVRGRRELLVVGLEALEPAADDLGHAGEVVGALDRPDPEPSVLALCRASSLEHDHGGHGVGPHGVRDVVALDPNRQLRECELLAQPVERRGDPVAPGFIQHPLVLQPEFRVAHGHLQDSAFIPPPGTAYLDAGSPQTREVVGERTQLVLAVVGLDEDLAWNGGRAVVLGDELERDVFGPRLTVVVEEERIAVHDLAFAHGEDLHAGRLALGVGAEGIERVLRSDGRLLAVANVGEGGDLVAQLRRPLEVLVPGSLAHGGFALADQTVYPPLQKGDDVRDDPIVVLLGDGPDARSGRTPDVVVETRHSAAASGLRTAALAEGESLVQHVERRVYAAGARERSEVAVARVVGGAGGENPGVLVSGSDHYVGVALVVLERGVEARPVALYQVRLEDERLGLAPRNDEIYLPDAFPELRDFRASVSRAVEIAGNPAAHVLGLAHVNYRVSSVLEDVDTGRGRKV